MNCGNCLMERIEIVKLRADGSCPKCHAKPTKKKYVVIFDPNHNMGTEYLRIHAAGCGDVAKEIKKSENHWTELAIAPMDAVKDEIDDGQFEVKNVKVCPCCK